MKQFDVVICGGAMAGSTLALALAKQCPTLTIAIIEAQSPQTSTHPGYDARSIALAQGSVETLTQWGIWSHLVDHATAIRHIHVSDRGHAGITRIAASDYQLPALGHVVELAEVGRRYQAMLAAIPSITLYQPDSVAQLHADATGYNVTLSSGEQCHARLVVAADGGQSTLSGMLNVGQSQHDFEQVALIANVTTAQAHQGRAFERFTSEGPIAMLPMSEGRSSLVWCMSADRAERLQQCDESVFLSELQTAFGWRLGALQKTGRRDCYPLVLRQRQSVIAHHAVIIGNAAQSLHPIAGQGFNLGLRDVAELVKQLQAADDIGSQTVLQRYHQARSRDRQTTVGLTSGLVSLFSSRFLPFVAGRNLGLIAMGQCGHLKRPLINKTIGWTS